MPHSPRRPLMFPLACALILSLVGVFGIVPAAPSAAAPPTVDGTQVFPADNIWNRTVTDLPIHANSANFLNSIGLGSGLKADFGSGTWEGGKIGIPYITVPGSQPKVPIHYTDYGDESDPGPMPIPPDAPREWGSDHHVIVVDRDNGILYELYNASKNSDNSWNASSGAIWSLRDNEMRPDGWTSADAAGLPIFPGLARYDEVAAGVIPHALRFTVPRTQSAYVWPASHEASSSTDPNRPPMGLRVRLKADVDISDYPYEARVILQCLKDYGMILADNGSAFYISGAPDERWDNDNLALLRSVKGSDLEVVDASGVMVAPNSTQARPVGGSPSPSPATYTLTTGAQGSGSVSPGSSTHAANAQVRLTATPDPGWRLDRWRVDGRDMSGSGPLLLMMNRNRTVSAVFLPGSGGTPGGGTQALNLTTSGAGSVTPGEGDYDTGLTVLLDATPSPGWSFAGWTVDGEIAGYAPTLSVTLERGHDVVATFVPRPSYRDVPTGHAAYAAITQLGGTGIIRGYTDGNFGPRDHTLRSQMAALIVRAMGWGAEDWGNNFPDRDGTGDGLWRNVGTLAHYGVAKGYTDGRFGPNDRVTQLQSISFITRAFVARGWWEAQPDNPALYPGLDATPGMRGDLATFIHYAGTVPGTAGTSASWSAAHTPAERGWFALTLRQAVESYWGWTP